MTEGDWQALLVTLKLATVTTILLLLIALPLSFWLARTKSRWQPFVQALVGLPLVLPPTVIGFYLLIFYGKIGGLGIYPDTLAFRFEGLVIGSVIYSLPFVVQPLQTSFVMINNRVFEVAQTLGCSRVTRIAFLALPMAKTGVLAAAVMGFAHTVGEFGIVLMIGGSLGGETKVLSIALYEHVETLRYDQAHNLSAGLLLFSLITLFIVYRFNRRRGHHATLC